MAGVHVGALGVGVVAVSLVAAEPNGVQKVHHLVAALLAEDKRCWQAAKKTNRVMLLMHYAL